MHVGPGVCVRTDLAQAHLDTGQSPAHACGSHTHEDPRVCTAPQSPQAPPGGRQGEAGRLGAPVPPPQAPACDKASSGPVILLNLTLGYFEQEIKGDYNQHCQGATLPRQACSAYLLPGAGARPTHASPTCHRPLPPCASHALARPGGGPLVEGQPTRAWAGSLGTTGTRSRDSPWGGTLEVTGQTMKGPRRPLTVSLLWGGRPKHVPPGP